MILIISLFWKNAEKLQLNACLIEFESMRKYDKYEGAERCYAGLRKYLQGVSKSDF